MKVSLDRNTGRALAVAASAVLGESKQKGGKQAMQNPPPEAQVGTIHHPKVFLIAYCYVNCFLTPVFS